MIPLQLYLSGFLSYRDPIEVAREKADWILANHQPEPLSEAQQNELKRIIRAAEQELAQ